MHGELQRHRIRSLTELRLQRRSITSEPFPILVELPTPQIAIHKSMDGLHNAMHSCDVTCWAAG